MMRININITIVDMVDQNYRKTPNKTVFKSECFEKQIPLSAGNDSNLNLDENQKMISLERKLMDALEVINQLKLFGKN